MQCRTAEGEDAEVLNHVVEVASLVSITKERMVIEAATREPIETRRLSRPRITR